MKSRSLHISMGEHSDLSWSRALLSALSSHLALSMFSRNEVNSTDSLYCYCLSLVRIAAAFAELFSADCSVAGRSLGLV